MQAATTTIAAIEESQHYNAFLKFASKKSPRTLQAYQDAIRLYVRDGGFSSVDDLVNGSANKLEDKIKAYFEKVSRPRADAAMKALKVFYLANRKTLDWNFIQAAKPARPDIAATDKPYPKEQVKALIKAAPNARVKLAIQAMASGGLRVGALPGVKVQDLTWINAHSLYAINVYAGTKSQYLTFITPTASELMRRFTQCRPAQRPVFYNLFEPDLPATKSAHVVSIWRLLIQTELRTPNKPSESYIDHGFRKTFRTALDAGGLREDMAERLIGHSSKLVKTYSKPDPEQWLQDSGYLSAVPFLTF
jgi:integrase